MRHTSLKLSTSNLLLLINSEVRCCLLMLNIKIPQALVRTSRLTTDTKVLWSGAAKASQDKTRPSPQALRTTMVPSSPAITIFSMKDVRMT